MLHLRLNPLRHSTTSSSFSSMTFLFSTFYNVIFSFIQSSDKSTRSKSDNQIIIKKKQKVIIIFLLEKNSRRAHVLILIYTYIFLQYGIVVDREKKNRWSIDFFFLLSSFESLRSLLMMIISYFFL